MLGITPVFILAAIIESFLTRYTDAPTLLKLILILLSAFFIVGYFVVYPWLKSGKGFEFPLKDVRIPPSNIEPANFTRIKNNADILKDAFQFYSRNSNHILPWILMATLGVSVATLFLEEESFTYVEAEWWGSLFSDMFYALDTPSPLFILINTLGTGAIIYRVMKLIDGDSKAKAFSIETKPLLQTLIITGLIYTAIYLGGWGISFLVFSFGILIFIGFVQLTESSSLLQGLTRGWDLFRKNNNQGLALQFIVLLLSFAFLLVLTAPLFYIHMSVVQWNFDSSDPSSKMFIRFLELFVKVLSFYLVLPLIIANISYLYFSQEEVGSAKNLKESIAKMGMRLSKTTRR
jgi:hypothetical protein